MCGIVGYVGPRDCVDILIEGLKRLEYRGYDSAGIAVQMNGSVATEKTAGKISSLEHILTQRRPRGSLGIGHTRWATHGEPTTHNAHPHATGPFGPPPIALSAAQVAHVSELVCEFDFLAVLAGLPTEDTETASVAP